MDMAASALNDQLHWYKDAIIYELHIKAFRDSNRDGIGDFKGLMEKLDYLQELGVTAIWLLPFYPSPLRDDGYDIADYYSINPRYGTMEQFQTLLQEAHKRGLKVITELVINHTSDQHPWFQRARKAPRDSDERKYYVWTDDPHQYKDVRIIFQDFETSNWTWDPVAQQYYWHRFFHHQPDLNYDHPAVQDEIFRIIDFWCDMGVDGFRLDAVPYLYEREGTNGENLPETHVFLKKLRSHIDEKYPGVCFLAEANMWPEDSASYFGNGDECHMNYHFPLMPRMFMSVQQEDRYPITDIFEQTPAIPDTCQWAMFLRNHDELTLEMVTDEERDFMYKTYAKDPKARINLGIRHRLAPLMDNNRNKIELMNSLLFSMRGTPVIYYGDEIGMGDNFYLGDRDGVRTPMQWSPDKNAGFSESNPQQLYLPVVIDPEYNYGAVNVEMQRKNTSSLFWFMKKMINMRRQYKAFSRGDMKFINVENGKVLAFTRTYEEQTLLIICNLSKYAQPAEIDLRAFKGFYPVEAFSRNRFPMIPESSPYFFTLGPHAFQWYVLEKANVDEEKHEELPVLQINETDDLLKGEARAALETVILPAWIYSRRWFQGKEGKLFQLKIINEFKLDIRERSFYFLLLECTYESGLPEVYQLCLHIAPETEIHDAALASPESVVSRVSLNGTDAVLADGFYAPQLHRYFLQSFQSGTELNSAADTFTFTTEEPMEAEGNLEILTRMHDGDVNNTSISYGNRYFLKMYRKVDATENPDLELTRYLSGPAAFQFVPRYLGQVGWHTDRGIVSLGILQQLIENHGDGVSYMMERIQNFAERILARDTTSFDPEEKEGTVTEPVPFSALDEKLQGILGDRAADMACLIGKRTGEMHLALAAGEGTDFKPEEYSLHYQRSLFSTLQGLVRESFDSMDKAWRGLPEELKEEAGGLRAEREKLLQKLKSIYQKKLDILKTRTHGTYNLKKLLMTGRDVVIQDFGGKPARSFSERRIKRSPLRDVAEMIVSFHYTAYEGFFSNTHLTESTRKQLLPFAELWAHYMSGFFMQAYLGEVRGSSIVPADSEDLKTVMHTFLLEKALNHFNAELRHRPQRAIIPLRIMKAILEPQAGVNA